MNKQKIINDIKQEYLIKRYKAQEDCENFIENLRKNSDFDNLYIKYTSAQIQVLKTDIENAKQQLNNQIKELKNQITKFLKDNNINEKNLQPKFDCEMCKDTGIVNGSVCECFKNQVNKRLSKLTCSQTEFKDFSKMDANIMSENDIKVSEWLKAWCEKYPNVTKTNINIIGGAGTGKTFLLECVASEMINKNFVVCYKTAFELNELARLYHIGKSFDFSDCINADILLIDDLGTEPVLKNVTKEYLYNLINLRQVKNKATLISTNLSLDNILARYDDRIFSRLGNKNLAINIQLTSDDKRLK